MRRMIFVMLAMGAAVHAFSDTGHPIYPEALTEEQIESARASAAGVMEMSEEQIRALITEKAGFHEIRCANCNAGHQGRQLEWAPAAPDQVKCAYCGHIYPSEQYPMDQVYEHQAPTGEIQQYPYYEGPDGFRHFFQAKIDYHARLWAASSAYQCARVYNATGDDAYARKAAVILHRLAEVYPHLPIHGLSDYSFRRPAFYDNEPPHPYLSQKLGSTWFYGEISTASVSAYDLIHESEAWAELSAAHGVDVREMVERDYIRAMAEFTLQQDRRWLTNMTPAWSRGLIMVGRIVDEPSYVHYAAGMLRDLLRQDFFADGMWKEGSVSYHRQTAAGINGAWKRAEGYSDPPGYVYPETGERFDNLDPLATETFLQRCLQAQEVLAWPDGTYCCVHDTWPSHRTDSSPAAVSGMLWAMGHAALGSGEGEARAQAQLHFSGSHGHSHADPLNLTYWAGGRTLVSDLGYTHTIYRRYATSSASHNVVIIDEEDLARGSGSLPWAGEMRFWEPDGPLARAISVDQPDASAKATRYQRTVVLVSRPDGPAYLVDLFDVTGGSQHDWLLRGSADHDQSATAFSHEMDALDHTLLGPDRTMVPYINEGGASTVPIGAENANVEVAEGQQTQYNVYGIIRDLHHVATDDDFAAAFEFEDEGPKLTIHLLGEVGSEYYLAQAPSIRRAEEDGARVDDYLQPVLIARRSGDAPLQSRFAALLWPGEDEAPQVRPLHAGDELVGVEVRHGGFRDVIVAPVNLPEASLTLDEIPVTMDAPLVVLRFSGDELVAAQATGGSTLNVDDQQIALTPELRATITSATGGYEAGSPRIEIPGLTDADLPANGRPVVVEHANGRFSLLRYIGRDGDAIEITEPPDFDVQGDLTRFHYYPISEIEGRPVARIQPLTWWTPE